MSPQARIRAIVIVAAIGSLAELDPQPTIAAQALAGVLTGSMADASRMADVRTGAAVATPVGQDGRLLVAGGSRLFSAEPYGFGTVVTDTGYYAPGEEVAITGSAWKPGGEVTLLLHDSARPHDGRSVTEVADTTGGISNDEFMPEPHAPAARFVTAQESVSQNRAALIATATLTDAGPHPQSLALSVAAEADVLESKDDEDHGLAAVAHPPVWSDSARHIDAPSSPPEHKQDQWDQLLEFVKNVDVLASKVAGVFSYVGKVNTVIDTVRTLIDFFGTVHAPSEYERIMQQMKSQFGALIWWLNTHEHLTRLIEVNRAAAHARDAMKEGRRLDPDSDPVYWSGVATELAATYLYSLRAYNDRIDADLEPEGPEGLFVFDWRLPVPALMQIVALRLQILAASNSEFRYSEEAGKELEGYRVALSDRRERMDGGVEHRRDWESSCEGPLGDPWPSDVTLMSRDKYGKLFESATYLNEACICLVQIVACPSLPRETPMFDQLDRRLRNRMPFFEMQSMIDSLHSVANPDKPDLTEIYSVIQPSHNTSLCLEAHRGRVVVGGIGAEFRPVALEDCNGSAAQRWVYDRTKFTVLNPESGKCLAAHSPEPKPKTWIVTDTCDDSQRQQWTYDQVSKMLLNGTGTVLDVQWGKLEPGTPLWTWDPNSGPAQQFESGFFLAMYVPVLL